MNKCITWVLIVGGLLTYIIPAFSQNVSRQPFNPSQKIGLTLSGGGAKGLAYIGLLKKIDSLGIKISYITGTSMGGIVGGLYAMGYTGKQLEDIVKNIAWDRVLSNTVPLNQINIEEKDEYGNYLLELPLKNGKPGLPAAAIEGQYLSEFLNERTFAVRNINDFSQLFIPLHIATADIVNGGTVFQQSGSLPLAIRATMSIPGVFSSVYIDGKLLVDGGVDRNYPVDEVRKMGADYVIGGYTGFHLLKEDKMSSPINQLMQVFTFSGIADIKSQRDQTDVFVDYTDLLDEFSAADFKKYQEILKLGEIAAERCLPQLQQIADLQRANGINLTRPVLPDTPIPVTKYVFVTDKNEPITDPDELDKLQQAWKLKTGKFYSSGEINLAIQKLYGTRRYAKVYYTFNNSPAGLEMSIHLKRHAKGYFKTAIHYDSDQSAGVVLNYTYYDLLFNRSRFLATIDATERLKGRIDYYKFISGNNKLWVKANAEYRNFKSNDVLLSLLSTNDLNVSSPDYFNKDFRTSTVLGYSISRSAYFEVGLGYQAESIYQSNSLASAILHLNPDNTPYSHHNQNATFRFFQNTFSSPYYPVKGNKFEAEFKYAFNHRLKLAEPADPNGATVYQYLNPNGSIYKASGIPGNVSRISVREQAAIPFSSKLTVRLSAMAGVNSSSNFGTNKDSYFYLNNYFRLGGSDEREMTSNIRFVGLKLGEVPVRSLSAIELAVQYSPVNKFYIIPTFNYAGDGDGYNITANYFNRKYDYRGYGLHLGYMSVIGPVDFVASKAEVGGISFPWRAYLSFGYKF
jgi:NTE family protein